MSPSVGAPGKQLALFDPSAYDIRDGRPALRNSVVEEILANPNVSNTLRKILDGVEYASSDLLNAAGTLFGEAGRSNGLGWLGPLISKAISGMTNGIISGAIQNGQQRLDELEYNRNARGWSEQSYNYRMEDGREIRMPSVFSNERYDAYQRYSNPNLYAGPRGSYSDMYAGRGSFGSIIDEAARRGAFSETLSKDQERALAAAKPEEQEGLRLKFELENHQKVMSLITAMLDVMSSITNKIIDSIRSIGR